MRQLTLWLLSIILITTSTFGDDGPVVFPLDPVALAEGREVPGNAEWTLVRDSYEYHFESEESRKKFEAQPGTFEIQLGGACARMGSLSGRGRPHLFARHNDRLYLFASESCRSNFLKAPEKLLLTDDEEPATTAVEISSGQMMVQLFLKSVGSVAVLESLESIQMMTTKKVLSGGTEYVNRREVAFRTSGDNRYDEWWNASRFGRLESNGTGWFIESDGARPMVKIQMRDHRNDLSEHYAGLLMDLLEPAESTVLRSLPSATENGRTWNQLELYSHGIRKLLTQDAASGRIHRLQFRGHGPTLAVVPITIEFDDFQTVSELTLPKVSLRLAEGQNRDKGIRSEWTYVVNPELPEDHFRPPGAAR